MKGKWFDLATTCELEATKKATELVLQLEGDREDVALEAMRWGEAVTHCMELLLADKSGKWKGYMDACARLQSYTLTISTKPVASLSLREFQAAIDSAAAVPGRTGETVSRIKSHVDYIFKRLHVAGIAKTRWELDIIWPTSKGEALPSATLEGNELAAFLACDACPLEIRAATAVVYDVINGRVSDLRALTWEALGAPNFDRVVMGNVKMRRKDDRAGRTTATAKQLLRAYYSDRTKAAELLEEPLGEPFTRGSDNWAKTLRREVARSMQIKLGWENNAGHGRNSRNVETGRLSIPAPGEWTERQRELFLGSPERRPLSFHASRTSFNARLAAVVTDPLEREAITSQTAAVVKKHYHEKTQIDATQPDPLVPSIAPNLSVVRRRKGAQ